MANELALALITPYSLRKSRTGGIIGRLILRTGLDLVGVRMIAPSQQLVDDYAALLRDHGNTEGTDFDEGQLLSTYVAGSFAPEANTGKRRRTMLLLFEGENAIQRINQAIGSFTARPMSAQSIRDTYGDLVRNEAGDVVFLEPAVISSPTAEKTAEVLQLWVNGTEADERPLKNLAVAPDGDDIEQTLVLLKPDNFRFASVRPGIIIDIFSSSGLQIVGAKIDRLSVEEALEFYGPVKEILRSKRKAETAMRSRQAIEAALGHPLPDEVEDPLGELIGPHVGDRIFNELVEFMTGRWAPSCKPEEFGVPGEARILALVYSGRDAVSKIRSILGPTDPSKAEPGSVRKEYGQDVMVNAAHASDSPENAQREMKIIKIHRDGLQKLLARHGI